MADDIQSVAGQATQQLVPPVTPPKATGTVASSAPSKLPKIEFWTAVRIAAFGVIILWTLVNIALFWANGITPRGLIWAIWWPAFFMVQFTVFTTPWRAVKAKEMVRMFLIGMGIVFFAIYFAELAMVGVLTAFPEINPIKAVLSLDFVLGSYDPLSDVASPIVEEVFKVLPVVIYLLIAGQGYWKRALGPLDIALLCGSVGAGFQFMENIARVTNSYMSTLGWDRSVRPASFGIDPFFLFPDMYHGSVSVWPGHAESAMVIGLFLGFGLLLRKKLPYVWAILPALGMLWMIWLHLLINYLRPGAPQFWAKLVMAMDLNGGLVQYVLILGLLLAIGVSIATKFFFLQVDKKATVAVVGKETLEYLKANQKEPLLILKKLWSLRHFWAYRHALAYGALYANQQKPEEREEWLPWLYGLRQMALGKPAEEV
ncbi:PrsW family glutamic-type intramembrane protease [Methanocella sp. MCL-LM]|uniref:PrsW family glutamic-type intramembrane protease n=1 Tax=Methanocella sp. MCL-LM TaxID=3412035 RepID=UPI003C7484E8